VIYAYIFSFDISVPKMRAHIQTITVRQNVSDKTNRHSQIRKATIKMPCMQNKKRLHYGVGMT